MVSFLLALKKKISAIRSPCSGKGSPSQRARKLNNTTGDYRMKFISLCRVVTISLGISILMGSASLPLITPVNAQQFSPFSDFQSMHLDELDYGNADIAEAQISANERRVTGGPFKGTRVRDSRIDIQYT